MDKSRAELLGRCANCLKIIDTDDDYIMIEGERITMKETQQIYHLLACSEYCITRAIRPATPDMREQPKENHPRKGEHTDTFECDYCGVESTYAADRVDIEIQGNGEYYGLIMVNNYCSEACMNSALSIGADFYEWSFTSYNKKTCMRQKLKDRGIA